MGFALDSMNRQFVALQEYALWDTAVLNATLKNMNCVIFKIKEDIALSDPEILIWVFDNWLLEVGCEIEDLKDVINFDLNEQI